MNIDLICVSNKQSDWVIKESKTYLKRLPKWLNVKVTLVTPVKSRMSVEMEVSGRGPKD